MIKEDKTNEIESLTKHLSDFILKCNEKDLQIHELKEKLENSLDGAYMEGYFAGQNDMDRSNVEQIKRLRECLEYFAIPGPEDSLWYKMGLWRRAQGALNGTLDD